MVGSYTYVNDVLSECGMLLKNYWNLKLNFERAHGHIRRQFPVEGETLIYNSPSRSAPRNNFDYYSFDYSPTVWRSVVSNRLACRPITHPHRVRLIYGNIYRPTDLSDLSRWLFTCLAYVPFYRLQTHVFLHTDGWELWGKKPLKLFSIRRRTHRPKRPPKSILIRNVGKLKTE